ncbi:hypothetical protein NCG89_13800 [Spongiibacter taiwanensis]|uniref:acyl-CoA carboxylase subunit beta n=1 Tax=Spongiibacter taiwanensis TaxID=1748242 RepID=UPI0020351606|nr:carboxyl transferase domain-containing protein [Spongiibacter taiwanensis]USA42603.1 hypothetical protein NCG89_13800 [Spongiibacter taiwanensis]
MPDQHSLANQLDEQKRKCLDEARPEAVEYQHQRGKLTARERVALLLDDDSFNEFGALVIPDCEGRIEPEHVADGLITGWGTINQRAVLLCSADYTVNGGSNGSLGLKKMQRCFELALAHGVPSVQLLEGVGHRISEGLDSRLFAEGVASIAVQAGLSGWVPTVAAVLGPSFAAMTIVASLCDFVVMVRGTSALGIAPPPLVKAAIGETIDTQALGGADVQANRNGVADYLVDTEADAMAIIRQYLSYFPQNADEKAPVVDAKPPDPDFARSLATLIPEDKRTPYNVKHAIYGIVDQGSVLEVKAGYARNIVCCLARIGGQSIGIIANQTNYLAGALDSPACEKASHFLCLCDAFGIPILSLMDLPGFMVGKDAESSKLARRSARLFYEFARISVPSYTVVLRKAFGAAYMAMNGGRSYKADLSLAWPTAEFAAMNVETAINVAYKRQIASAAEPDKARADITAKVRKNLGPLRAASGFGIDDVISPEQTRDYLLQAMNRSGKRKAGRSGVPRHRHIPPI